MCCLSSYSIDTNISWTSEERHAKLIQYKSNYCVQHFSAILSLFILELGSILYLYNNVMLIMTMPNSGQG